jgi:glutamate/tyrosine decarboxylase-like PLP-dependent enzyme
LADLIERTCRHARHFAKELKAAGYPILNDVVLNQVLVSFGDAETTHRVIAIFKPRGLVGVAVRFGKGRRRCELVFRLGQQRMLM